MFHAAGRVVELAKPPRSSSVSLAFHLLLVLWKIWDAPNAKTFKDVSLSPTDVIRVIISDLTLWSHRLKKADQKIHAGLWWDLFTSRLT